VTRCSLVQFYKLRRNLRSSQCNQKRKQ